MKWLLLVVLTVAGNACDFRDRGMDALKVGAEAERNGDYEKAINSYSRAIESGELPKPDLVAAYNARGKVYAQRSRFEQATADFDAAIRLNPDDAFGYYNRGRITQDDDKARQEFDNAIRLKPDHFDAFFERGNIHNRAGDYDRAIADYTSAIRLNPNHTSAHISRGGLYHLKGDYDKAIADYNVAIHSNPKDDIARIFRGGSYYEKQMFDRARADFDAALGLNPRSSIAFSSRGMVKAAQADHDGAISDFDTALKLYPDDEDIAMILVERGRAYRRKGDLDRAIDDLTDAIRLNPDRGEAFRLRGITLRQMNQHKRALGDFDAAVRDPNSNQNYYSRGLEHFYLGQFALSVKDLTRAVELKPDHAFAAIWLFLAQSRSGQNGARLLAEHAKRLEPTPWIRSIVDFLMGKLASEAVLHTAKDADPKKDREQHCEAYFYLGQKALMRGNRSEAIRFFKLTLDTGVTNFVEYSGAESELTRLLQTK